LGIRGPVGRHGFLEKTFLRKNFHLQEVDGEKSYQQWEAAQVATGALPCWTGLKALGLAASSFRTVSISFKQQYNEKRPTSMRSELGSGVYRAPNRVFIHMNLRQKEPLTPRTPVRGLPVGGGLTETRIRTKGPATRAFGTNVSKRHGLRAIIGPRAHSARASWYSARWCMGTVGARIAPICRTVARYKRPRGQAINTPQGSHLPAHRISPLKLQFFEKKREHLLQKLDQLSFRAIGIGFPFLTIGILSGSVWANEAWGSYWNWDPKETWSLITWIIFAIYLHLRFTKNWNGFKSAILATVGLMSVWICFLGVNFLAKGLHSYGWFHSYL